MKTLEQQRHMLLEMTNTINTPGERNTTRAEFKRELTQALKEAEERGRQQGIHEMKQITEAVVTAYNQKDV